RSDRRRASGHHALRTGWLFTSSHGVTKGLTPDMEISQAAEKTQWATVTVTPATTATATIPPEPSPEPTPTPDPTPAPEWSEPKTPSVYLADLTYGWGEFAGYSRRGAYDINGKTYDRSIGLTLGGVGQTRWTEYLIDGDYRTFEATLGVNDRDAVGSIAEFEIYGDGLLLLRKRVEYAKPVRISVDIRDVMNLQLAVTRIAPFDTYYTRWTRGAVFGDASLTQ
ncbi:NPCBM/NEW2 domain-containing protein, partial [Sphaerimonospora cavernae]